MLINDNPKKLIEKLELAKKQLNNAKSREEKLAITNYIGILCDSINNVEPTTPLNKKGIKRLNKNIRISNNMVDKYASGTIKNYIATKSFHNSFFESMHRRISHERKKIEVGLYSEVTLLQEDDFYNIFFEFVNSIGLSKYFDKYIKSGRVYKTRIETADELGYILYNPLTKDSNIFVTEMDYNISSLFVLVHEFGHAYDFNKFSGTTKEYNHYLFQSFCIETISKTFERLFLDFLIERNILKDEAIDELFDMSNDNFVTITQAYILSLIPDLYIYDNSYEELSQTKIYKLVEKYFSRNSGIKKIIYYSDQPLNVYYTNNYAYGDVFSMFLKEKIKENDGKLDVLDEFFEFRGKLFKPSMLDKYNITPSNYVKLYKKEIELLKKQSN